jgi:uncharacterized membrane protein required for colicin V production
LLDNPTQSKAFSLLTLLYLALFLGGGALLYFSGLKPALKTFNATGWQKTSCRILESALVQHESRDSKTRRTSYYYTPHITYSYHFNDQQYVSSRFNLWDSGATEGEKVIIRNHPTGAQGLCFVNPDNPAEAVFYPRIPLNMVMLLFLGLLLSLPGGLGLIHDFRAFLFAIGWLHPKRKTPATTFARQMVLQTKPKKAITGKRFFYVLLTVAVIWNTFNLLFLAIVFRQLGSGSTDFLSLFFSLLIGVPLAIFTVRKYLSFLEPQLILKIDAPAIYVGVPFPLAWEFSGRAKLVTHLQVFLEAFEAEGISKSDEKGSLEKMPATRLSSVKVIDSLTNAEGSTTVTLPEDSKPSVKDSEKEVFWVFRTRWGTEKNPENKDKFPVPVLPSAGVPVQAGETPGSD